MKRTFWANYRPTSTEDETSTENSYYPRSDTETEISGENSEQPLEIIEDQIKNLELSKIELKNENRKLEYKIKRYQKNERYQENERIELENELFTCKSRIDYLESDIRRLEIQKKKYQTELQEKQAQLEKYQKDNKAMIKCKLLG